MEIVYVILSGIRRGTLSRDCQFTRIYKKAEWLSGIDWLGDLNHKYKKLLLIMLRM